MEKINKIKTSILKIDSKERIKNMIDKIYKNKNEKGHTNSTEVISGNLKLEVNFRNYHDYYNFYFNNENILIFCKNENSYIKEINFKLIGNLKNFNNLLTGIDENIKDIFLEYLIGNDIKKFDSFYNNIILNGKKENNILGLSKQEFLEKFISKYEKKIEDIINYNKYLEGFGIKNKI